MRRFVYIFFVLLFCSSLSFGQAAKKLTPDELEKALEKRGGVFFLDVRDPAEIQKLGSIPGYVNIPLGQLESRLKEVPKDKPVITACSHGVRAAKAAALLEKNGFKVLGACGLEEWKEKGKKVVYPEAEKKKS